MNTKLLIRRAIFLLFVKPLAGIILGVNVRNRDRLPLAGPAIIVANHNSHLDTLVIMNLFPIRLLEQIRPVAAADYFLKRRLVSWFVLEILNIIPIERRPGKTEDPLAGPAAGLERGEILLLFPEGSRGDPEKLQTFKSGIAHLARRFPEVPVIPVFIQGLGRALPKDELLLVPFFCDMAVGEKLYGTCSKADFMERLNSTMQSLASECQALLWE